MEDQINPLSTEPIRRRGASFLLSAELLCEALGLPTHWEIAFVQWDFPNQHLEVFVKGYDLPEWRPGELAQEISLTMKSHPSAHMINWDTYSKDAKK